MKSMAMDSQWPWIPNGHGSLHGHGNLHGHENPSLGHGMDAYIYSIAYIYITLGGIWISMGNPKLWGFPWPLEAPWPRGVHGH